MRHKEEIRVSRVYNFSAGPAVLPEEVLQEAAAEMMDYKGSGMSVMEVVKRCNIMVQRYYILWVSVKLSGRKEFLAFIMVG